MTGIPARAPRPVAFLLTLWCAYVAMVVYASLAPFSPWESLRELRWSFLVAPLPRHITSFDLLVNVLAYAPVGALAAAVFSRSRPGVPAVARAALSGLLLSFSMELLQSLVPPRIPSNVDLLSNGLGGLLGALPWCAPARLERLLRPIESWRDRLLLPGAGPEIGACLLLLWCACHLNPSIPFLGAGVLQNPYALAWYETATDPVGWALQACAAALNACGLGFFLAGLLHARVNALAMALVGLLTVLGAKATAAEFLLKPVLAGDWFGSATLAGLAAGALVLVAAQELSRRRRAMAAGACLLAGGLLAKLGSTYAPLSGLRSLFGWNFVQLRNFAGLTVWLNEIWPLLALAFLALWWPHTPDRINQVSSRP
jgi:VanZ family protein